MNATKLCTKCNTEKFVTMFSKDKSKKDGYFSSCKECVKKYYIDNRDKRLKYCIKYNKKNSEKLKDYQKRYNEENIEVLITKRKEYYLNNKEVIQEKVKLYRYKNSEKVKESARRYGQKNKDKISEYRKKYTKTFSGNMASKNSNQKRRAKTKSGDVTTSQLKTLVKSYKNCYWCKCKLNKKNTHIDHYIPLSKGGEHTIDNLVTSCAECNLRKHTMMPEKFIKIIKQKKENLCQVA